MKMHNLLSLPHLHTKQTNGKEPLANYYKSHVVTFDQYINIKAMDKAIVKKIKEVKQKERKEKRSRKVIEMVIRVEM
jgi:hypothetical protein